MLGRSPAPSSDTPCSVPSLPTSCATRECAFPGQGHVHSLLVNVELGQGDKGKERPGENQGNRAKERDEKKRG